MNIIKVVLDTRERKLIAFPQVLEWYSSRSVSSKKITPVKRVRKKLEIGDIALLGKERIACIERKGSFQELGNNLFSDDYGRFLAAFENLANKCANPYLALTFKAVPLEPEDRFALDNILRVAALYSVRPLFIPMGETRTSLVRAGELMLRVLLSHCV